MSVSYKRCGVRTPWDIVDWPKGNIAPSPCARKSAHEGCHKDWWGRRWDNTTKHDKGGRNP